MFKDNVLDFVHGLIVNNLMFSVKSDSFDHNQTFIQDGYRVTIDVESVRDLTNCVTVPMVSVSYYTLDMTRESVFTITHELLYSNNGKGFEGHFSLTDNDSTEKLKRHGYSDDEIEKLKSIRFSINAFIQQQSHE